MISLSHLHSKCDADIRRLVTGGTVAAFVIEECYTYQYVSECVSTGFSSLHTISAFIYKKVTDRIILKETGHTALTKWHVRQIIPKLSLVRE